MNPNYVQLMRDASADWLGKAADDILWLNCAPAPTALRLFETGTPYRKNEPDAGTND